MRLLNRIHLSNLKYSMAERAWGNRSNSEAHRFLKRSLNRAIRRTASTAIAEGLRDATTR